MTNEAEKPTDATDTAGWLDGLVGPKPVEYGYDEHNNIVLPTGAPFDGNPVLIRTGTGWVEAWWCPLEWKETADGPESDGFIWVCYDDKFQHDLDDAIEWMPLPHSTPF